MTIRLRNVAALIYAMGIHVPRRGARRVLNQILSSSFNIQARAKDDLPNDGMGVLIRLDDGTVIRLVRLKATIDVMRMRNCVTEYVFRNNVDMMQKAATRLGGSRIVRVPRIVSADIATIGGHRFGLVRFEAIAGTPLDPERGAAKWAAALAKLHAAGFVHNRLLPRSMYTDGNVVTVVDMGFAIPKHAYISARLWHAMCVLDTVVTAGSYFRKRRMTRAAYAYLEEYMRRAPRRAAVRPHDFAQYVPAQWATLARQVDERLRRAARTGRASTSRSSLSRSTDFSPRISPLVARAVGGHGRRRARRRQRAYAMDSLGFSSMSLASSTGRRARRAASI